MAVCFLIGMPVALSLIVSGIIYFAATGADVSIAISQMCTKMFANYTILAVPMFVLMANLMNSGKVTTFLFDFCKALVGRRRGALAQVNVFVSLIFSGMSGSAVADASASG